MQVGPAAAPAPETFLSDAGVGAIKEASSGILVDANSRLNRAASVSCARRCSLRIDRRLASRNNTCSARHGVEHGPAEVAGQRRAERRHLPRGMPA